MANKRTRIVSGCYLVLAVFTIVYELGVRIFDRGNSEFAGMLSAVITIPSSLVLIAIGKGVFKTNVGDSDGSFVIILGLSALANACIVWVISGWLSRSK
jgi:hypothetical protein